MASSKPLTLAVDSFILGNPGRIRASAKRYVPQLPNGEVDTRRDSRVILLFAHALGFHKEHWEPAIKELFHKDRAIGCGVVTEAWTVDCPDHGESNILNEAELENGKRYISCYEYGDALISLIRSEYLARGQKLILVGHSAGAVSGILSTTRYHQSGANPYDSMILVEPAIISRDLLAADLGLQKVVAQLIKTSSTRRDIWPSADDAKSWLAQRSPWKLWDPRVLDLYVQFGMRPLPTRIYPDIDSGVTLSYPRLTHGLAYNNVQDQHDAMDQLKVICRTPDYKVHAVFGSRIDYNPKAVQDEIVSVVVGSPSGNVTYIKDAGHMIIQEDPTRVASALCRILHNDYGNARGKL